MVKRVQLSELHSRSAAKMAEFAGWEMPLWYSSISEEHLAVRNGVGIFDTSHMGEIIVTGNESLRFINYVTTNDAAKLSGHSGQYSAICNARGGIKDDVLVYALGGTGFMVVTNAVNTVKILDWLRSLQGGFRVEIYDATDSTAMFALQGPRAQETLQKIMPFDLRSLSRFGGQLARLAGEEVMVSRTGYTGEDGFEIYAKDTTVSDPTRALGLWKAIMDAGLEFGIRPCGLGSRDTLRLEAGLLLYGNDIDEGVTPLEARIDFAVRTEKEFVGRDVLVDQRVNGPKAVRIGFELSDRMVPRKGSAILLDGKAIGTVTSGTVSPLTRKAIGMGYVPPGYSGVGMELEVNIRGSSYEMHVTEWPFYDITKYGRSRAKPSG
jgi:aminomethyltransferase